MTYALLGQSNSIRVLASCAVVFLGYVVGSYGESGFSWLGVLYGVGASFFTAMNAIYVKKTLGAVNNDHWCVICDVFIRIRIDDCVQAAVILQYH